MEVLLMFYVELKHFLESEITYSIAFKTHTFP